MTGSGGIGILMADNACQLGLSLPPLSDAAVGTLRDILPFAVPANVPRPRAFLEKRKPRYVGRQAVVRQPSTMILQTPMIRPATP